jgi:hypothetical protein|tara:strand:+ start:106 stop:354 length:249 start_codon:yes stop_codon:yes gene_type:complete
MEITVTVEDYIVDVVVENYRPARPVRWGPTPEDSCESEDGELDFLIVSGKRLVESCDKDFYGEFPTRDDIEMKVVEALETLH